MTILSILDVNVDNQKVLIRVDYNVPLDENQNITDDTRIIKSLPTIQHVLKSGGSVILMSHLGRPNGKKEMKYSLSVCKKRLEALLGRSVQFADDCIGEETIRKAHSLKKGEVLLLENLRFYPAEEKPSLDPSFAKNLSKLGTIYVDDAFGCAHRPHSSITEIVKYFPHKAVMGLLMKEEVNYFTTLLEKPERPFFALIGGSKISSKIGVLSSLSEKVDEIFIGGGMAYTFLKALGHPIGNSIYEKEFEETAMSFLKKCKENKIEVHLPQDLIVADRFDNNANKKTILSKEGIPAGYEGMDIGPKTIADWSHRFKKCKTLFWNGPVGVFEMENFAHGTHAIAKAISDLDATTVVGGGDSVAAINQLGLDKKFSHISTGGGASLEMIELGHLPGVDCLKQGIK